MRQAWTTWTREVRSDLTSRLIITITNKSIGLTLDIDGNVLTGRSFLVQQFPEKLLPVLCISCFKMSNLGVFKCHTLGYLWTLAYTQVLSHWLYKRLYDTLIFRVRQAIGEKPPLPNHFDCRKQAWSTSAGENRFQLFSSRKPVSITFESSSNEDKQRILRASSNMTNFVSPTTTIPCILFPKYVHG